MKLKPTEFNEPFGPITHFAGAELPILTLLVGKNGSGKSQILNAIAKGKIEVHGVSKFETEIVLKDFSSIMPKDTGIAKGDGPLDPMAFWSLISNHHEKLRECWSDKLRECRSPEAIGPYTDVPSPGEVLTLLDERGRYWPAVGGLLVQENNYPPKWDLQLRTLCRSLGRPLHELTESEVLNSAGNYFSSFDNQLSLVFRNYRVAQLKAATEAANGSTITYPEAEVAYAKQYQPPWETFRNVLSELRVACSDDQAFNFDLTDPSQDLVDKYSIDKFTFTCKIVSRSTRAKISVDNLSSGEKVLMGLCLAAFNHYSGATKPKLLLLDEVDAVLHPSMIKGLNSVLQRVFVKEGVPVILATHSPTTVALLGANNVFRVEKEGGCFSLNAADMEEAIAQLSEGIFSFKEGSLIFQQLKTGINIMTEGKTNRILQVWANLKFPGELRVVKGFEGGSGVSNLYLLAGLNAQIGVERRIIYVVDCDAATQQPVKKLRESLKNGPMHGLRLHIFPNRFENPYASTGIENAFHPDLLAKFADDIQFLDAEPRKLFQDPSNKRKFEDWIVQRANLADFDQFEALASEVDELLEQDKQRQQA